MQRSFTTCILLAAALMTLARPAMTDQPPAGETGQLARLTSLRIGKYDYTLPDWWDSVEVSLPRSLKDWQAVSEHVRGRYSLDTGTPATWRQALKAWAIAYQRLNGFPVYLAHCHMTGGEYRRAAQIYSDLYQIVDTQPKELHDWYHCYLAYSAGEAYLLLNEPGLARQWLARSARFRDHANDAITYYAQASAKKLEALQ